MEIKSKEIVSIKTNSKYYVTSEGKIIGPRGEIKPRMGGYKKKYERFSVRINGIDKDFYIHRIVLTEFVGQPKKNEQACHNDGNTRNNKLENLRWDTPKNNSLDKIKHGTSGIGSKNSMSKITEFDSIAIITGYSFFGAKKLSKIFNIKPATVSQICTGKIRKNKNFESFYSHNKIISKCNVSSKYRKISENR